MMEPQKDLHETVDVLD